MDNSEAPSGFEPLQGAVRQSGGENARFAGSSRERDFAETEALEELRRFAEAAPELELGRCVECNGLDPDLVRYGYYEQDELEANEECKCEGGPR